MQLVARQLPIAVAVDAVEFAQDSWQPHADFSPVERAVSIDVRLYKEAVEASL